MRQHEGAVRPGVARLPGLDGGPVRPHATTCRASTIGGMSSIGENVGGTTVHSIYSFQPTYTQMTGSHTLRGGYDLRALQGDGFGPGRSAGQYDFAHQLHASARQLAHRRRPASSSRPSSSASRPAARSIATPTARTRRRTTDCGPGRLARRATADAQPRPALRVRRRHLRQRGSQRPRLRSRRATLAITRAAQAAYAPRPDPGDAAVGLPRARRPAVRRRRRPRLLERRTRTTGSRASASAYQLNDKTVLRGGFGVYTSPFVIAGVRQSGFSQSTNIVPAARQRA